MIRRELCLFCVFGALTVLIDYLTYHGLSSSQHLPLGIAKGVGFIAGTVFAYFVNRFWTFGGKHHKGGGVVRFSLLYALTLLTNIGINELAFVALNTLEGFVQIAFLIATVVSATMNFIGMKFFVFKAALPIKTT